MFSPRTKTLDIPAMSGAALDAAAPVSPYSRTGSVSRVTSSPASPSPVSSPVVFSPFKSASAEDASSMSDMSSLSGTNDSHDAVRNFLASTDSPATTPQKQPKRVHFQGDEPPTTDMQESRALGPKQTTAAVTKQSPVNRILDLNDNAELRTASMSSPEPQSRTTRRTDYPHIEIQQTAFTPTKSLTNFAMLVTSALATALIIVFVILVLRFGLSPVRAFMVVSRAVVPGADVTSAVFQSDFNPLYIA